MEEYTWICFRLRLADGTVMRSIHTGGTEDFIPHFQIIGGRSRIFGTRLEVPIPVILRGPYIDSVDTPLRLRESLVADIRRQGQRGKEHH